MWVVNRWPKRPLWHLLEMSHRSEHNYLRIFIHLQNLHKDNPSERDEQHGFEYHFAEKYDSFKIQKISKYINKDAVTSIHHFSCWTVLEISAMTIHLWRLRAARIKTTIPDLKASLLIFSSLEGNPFIFRLPYLCCSLWYTIIISGSFNLNKNP